MVSERQFSTLSLNGPNKSNGDKITIWYRLQYGTQYICVHGKLNHRAEEYYVGMRVLNLALHGVHTHSKGARGVHGMVRHSEV
jgi:hypothetical protein